MRKFKEYTIAFAGLKQGKHEFDYTIDNKFFELFNYDEFNSADQQVTVLLDKKSNMLELTFHSKGVVNVNCDVTNEPFDLPVEGKMYLVVKFGEEFNDENDEVLILPHGEYQLNVAQYIYEMIVLSVPAKRVHPGVEDGTLSSDILEKLEEYSPSEIDEAEEESETESIDPRWEELKK